MTLPVRDKIILAVLGLSIGLFTAEIGLRILPLPAVFDEYQSCVFVPDEQLGYRFQTGAEGNMLRNFEIENSFRINTDGFHDTEPENVNQRISILALGDSFTAALYVPLEKGWTQLLKTNLQNLGYPDVEVINRGVDGYGVENELELLKQTLPVNPSPLVILAFFENDVGDATLGRIYRECYRDYLLLYQNEEQLAGMVEFVETYAPTSLQTWLFEHLFLFRLVPLFPAGTRTLLRTNFVRPGDAGFPLEVNDDPRKLDALFQEMLAFSREENFHLLVIPLPGRVHGAASSLDALRANISPETFEALDVIQLAPLIASILARDNKQNADLFWKNDGHFNAYGNQVYAEAVAEILATQYEELLRP